MEKLFISMGNVKYSVRDKIGMFKMATGKDLGTENQKIEIDEKTGEVVLWFKLPGMGMGGSRDGYVGISPKLNHDYNI